MYKDNIKRGDIYYADLSPVVGFEIGGIRLVVIIQNDISNKYAPIVTVAPITSQIDKAKLPTHVEIPKDKYNFNNDSVILLEHVRTLDKKRLKTKIGKLSLEDIEKVNKSLVIALDIEGNYSDNLNIKKLKSAIDILQNLYKGNDYKEDDNSYNIEDYEETSKEWYKKVGDDITNISNQIGEFNTKFAKLEKRIEVSKGQLNEFAVEEYFKKSNYSSWRTKDLDHLKIDVVAINDKHKIYVQVKNGQIGKGEIKTLVKNIKSLDDGYDNRIVGVVASEFPVDAEMFRLYLQEEYRLQVMFIHKYQILKKCPEYSRSIG